MSAKSTRDHLIDVGLELMHQQGYNATGLTEILQGSGCAQGFVLSPLWQQGGVCRGCA